MSASTRPAATIASSIRTTGSSQALNSTNPVPKISPGSTSAPASPAPGAASASGMSGADYVLLGLAVIAVLAVAAIAAKRRITPIDPNADARAVFFQSATWRFIQTTLIGLLLIAAAWRSLASTSGPDTTTVTFLVLIVIVTVVPVVEKITFPSSGEIDLISSQVKSDAVDLSQNARLAQIAFATAAQVIADAQASLGMQLRGAELSPQDQRNAVERTLLTTTATVSALLVPGACSAPSPVPNSTAVASEATTSSAVEPFRISAWVKTQDSQGLQYVVGWPQSFVGPLQDVISILQDADPASIVFRTQQYLNYTDLPAAQRPPSDGVADFGGILILPMFAGASIIGVLQLERGKVERFEPAQVALGRALAALYGFALA